MLEWLEHCVKISVSQSLLVIFISVKCWYCNATVRPGWWGHHHHLLDVSTTTIHRTPYVLHYNNCVQSRSRSRSRSTPLWNEAIISYVALPQQQQLQLLLFCAPITLNLNPLQLIERREKGDLPAYFCAWELSTEGGGWEQYWLRLWL